MYEKVADIAKATKLSPKTIQRYKADPAFQEKLRLRRAEIARNTVSKMGSHLWECANTLMEIIRGHDTAPQTKVNAIQVMFNQYRELTQTVDVLERLEAIEKEISAENGF